jgi:hypothetical protein
MGTLAGDRAFLKMEINIEIEITTTVNMDDNSFSYGTVLRSVAENIGLGIPAGQTLIVTLLIL